MEDIAGEVIETMFPPGAEPQAVGLARDAMAAVPEDTYRAVVRVSGHLRPARQSRQHRRADPGIGGRERRQRARRYDGKKMAGRIPGARYHCMPGANHLANLECPDLFNGAIQQFLDQI